MVIRRRSGSKFVATYPGYRDFDWQYILVQPLVCMNSSRQTSITGTSTVISKEFLLWAMKTTNHSHYEEFSNGSVCSLLHTTYIVYPFCYDDRTLLSKESPQWTSLVTGLAQLFYFLSIEIIYIDVKTSLIN